MSLLLADRNPDSPAEVRIAYETGSGKMLVGRIEDALEHPVLQAVSGKVNLIFTSPPFPLVHKKRYGNRSGEEYVKWLRSLAPLLAQLLASDGSIVVEVGNAWEKGIPVMSTLPLESLLEFKRAGNLHLCQHIICHNPARLPSPVQWVNVKRVRLKDSYTHVWWMSPAESPKADNRRVLTPYGAKMRKLLRTQTYNAGRRPSGHVISGTGFLKDHGGAISPNVVDLSAPESNFPADLMRFTGTAWNKEYRAYCKRQGIEAHPARMPMELAAFFVQFLTEPGDLILDPFAGSNTTGFAAETLGRRWIGVEANPEYAIGSRGRFEQMRDEGNGDREV